MKKKIDCLIIGHNEMDFVEYEKTVRSMGIHSGSYRDLNLNFIRWNNTPYSLTDIFNLFCGSSGDSNCSFNPLHMTETFSAAIACLGTYLNKMGLTFDCINSFRQQKEELAEKLAKDDILTIAITTTLYVSVFPILEIVDFIKSNRSNAKIIVGGPFVSTRVRTRDAADLDYIFKPIDADFLVNSSQGESTLVEIIYALKNNKPVDEINNIYYKAGNRYLATPLVKENIDLSENMVDWGLFAGRVGAFANIRTAVSCPFSCAFCGFPQHAGPYRMAPVDAIEKELDSLQRIESVERIFFIDDTFNVPVKRFKHILKMLARKGYGFKWHSYFRSQFADREMVELMKESGCQGVFLGLESGDNQVLKNMNKATTAEDYLKGIELLKEHGIVTFGNFIIGFPGETSERVKRTLRFIEGSGLDFFRVQLWYCEPITPIWKEREKYRLKGESFEWKHAEMESGTACDWVDEIFLSVKSPVWIPQYNFDFDGIWHLVQRGFSLEQVREFLECFNRGIAEKLTTPSQPEVSLNTVKQLMNSCRTEKDLIPLGVEKMKANRIDADFDF